MKIVSFNVNGIRARPHQLQQLVDSHSPDVIGLQETKVHDDMFPHADIEALGYHAHIHGQKGHYGVALLVKSDTAQPTNVIKGFINDSDDAQKRFIGMQTVYNGAPLWIYNGYFPQGESQDHPTKFPNKRAFYADLMEHLSSNHSANDQVVVMGDMNISPADIDIGIGDANKKRWLRTGKCSFLPEEREWYQKLYDWGFTDAWRHLNPTEDKIYSWFDYRSKGFNDEPKRGLRIDHCLITAPLLGQLDDVIISYDIRAMEKPSDHCPVILALK